MTKDIALSSPLDESALATQLQTALRETVFSSGLNISPKRLNGIAKELARSYQVYFIDQDNPTVAQLGQSLAANGLAPRSVVSVTDRLRMATANESDAVGTLLEVTTDFCAALLIGFMDGRERIILQEAERTHRAYLAALNLH